MPPYEEYISEIKGIWDRCYLTNYGPKYCEFVSLLRERFGYENIDVQCNGHMTLQNILSCIEPGEIITTPFTFISTCAAIKNSNHTPVFCDINETDYTIDVDKVEELITDKTVAILAVHVFGAPCDIDSLARIGEKYGIKVVYDAAHAFGVNVNGVPIGHMGDASMFSFHATKVFNTIEGGLAVFGNKNWLDECKARSNFGIQNGEIVYSGVNSKMNEFQATMGILNLKYLDLNIQKRKKITELYDDSFRDMVLITTMKRKDNVDYNYSYYPLVMKDKGNKTIEGLLNALESEKIYARRYFYPALNTLDIFENKKSTPVAARISNNIICLPLYADMTQEEVVRVCKTVKEYCTNE